MTETLQNITLAPPADVFASAGAFTFAAPEFLPALPAYPIHRHAIPPIELCEGRYAMRFAHTTAELDAALRLRFEVFNLELGEGLAVSFRTGRDCDEFDATCHHLLVAERERGEVVGTYRLQTAELAAAGRGFYSASEFDLSHLAPAVLTDSVELGRACIAQAHRHTSALFLLWKGLAAYMRHNRKRYFFGCCSLTSQDETEGWRVMRRLEAEGHLHPKLFAPAQPAYALSPPSSGADNFARAHVPKLFHTYLRFGAKVCSLPAIDRAFGTIDFLVIFDTAGMSELMRRLIFAA